MGFCNDFLIRHSWWRFPCESIMTGMKAIRIGQSIHSMLSVRLAMHMRLSVNSRWVVWLILPFWAALISGALAEDRPADSPGVVERIGQTARKVGNKAEQGLTKAAAKLKEKKVGEKIERKLKKAVKKTEEGFNKTSRKIDQKLR